MISEFPVFKDVRFEDKDQVDAITEKFPPYSDFEFASLWAWNVKNEIQVSEIFGNLVVRFTDYISGEPVYSFLGTKDTNETASLLCAYATSQGHLPILRMVPEISIATLDSDRFSMSEDRDHFDYIYAIKSHVHYKEPELKNVRNTLNAHRRRHSGHTVTELNLSDVQTEKLIENLYERWQKKNGDVIPNESMALRRFLLDASKFQYLAVGILFENQLAAFSVTTLLSKGNCNCLFARGDTSYHGVYALLMHETAKVLIARGYQFMNYEQDLGIANLRRAKTAFHPTYFLKKYRVERRVDRPF